MTPPLIDSPKMPGFEKPIDSETKAKNEAYDEKANATPEETKEKQKEARKGFYGEFKSVEEKQPENTDSDINNQTKTEIRDDSNDNPEVEKNNSEENIELKKFEENPFSPVFKRFLKTTQIKLGSEDALKLAKAFNSSKDEKLDKEIVKEADIDKNLKSYLEKFILEVDRINPKKEVDEKGKVVIPKEFGNINVLKNGEDEVVQLLAQNYTRIPDGDDGSPDLKKDLDTTFEIALNKLVNGKNFPKTEAYELAILDIKTGDTESKFEALQYVYSLVNTKEGSKGIGSLNSFKKIKEGQEVKKLLKVRFENFKSSSKKLKSAVEKKELIKEGEDLFKDLENEEKASGEAFEGKKELEVIIKDLKDDIPEQKEQT